MSEIAIKVEGLSKRYRIGAQQLAYRNLREKLNDMAMAPYRAARHLLTRNGNGNPQSAIRNSKSETFWALKDLSFEVKRGEVVGIIGRNGAGKSTLLKILSRITEPTEGYADINGRIASLLEVGTGFHPELTGRENIYLNGSILGMKRAEIKRKFDEMVAFAEIDKFIDTPVKHYSSGMYVRLAFAVAAHLDPEILLVDEVLAVGDVAFQKKCLGKMGDVAREGRTVFLVSHQMTMIRNLSTQCILLGSGRIEAIGAPDKVVTRYLSHGEKNSTEWLAGDGEVGAEGRPYLSIRRFALVDQDGLTVPKVLSPLEEAFVTIEGDIEEVDNRVCMGFHLFDEQENPLFMSFQTDQPEVAWPQLDIGRFKIRARLDLDLLPEGRYRCVFVSGLHSIRWFQTSEHSEVSISFEVVGNASRSPYWTGKRNTLFSRVLKWEKAGGR